MCYLRRQMAANFGFCVWRAHVNARRVRDSASGGSQASIGVISGFEQGQVSKLDFSFHCARQMKSKQQSVVLGDKNTRRSLHHLINVQLPRPQNAQAAPKFFSQLIPLPTQLQFLSIHLLFSKFQPPPFINPTPLDFGTPFKLPLSGLKIKQTHQQCGRWKFK